MVKFSEIGNFNAAKNYPGMAFSSGAANWSLCVADHAARTAALPDAAAAKGKGLCIVMQDWGDYIGDRYFGPENQEGALIPAGDKVLLVGIDSLAGRFLDIDAQHIDYSGAFSAAVAPGVFLVAGTDGRFAVESDVSAYETYFLVTEVFPWPLAKPLADSPGSARAQVVLQTV